MYMLLGLLCDDVIIIEYDLYMLMCFIYSYTGSKIFILVRKMCVFG